MCCKAIYDTDASVSNITFQDKDLDELLDLQIHMAWKKYMQRKPANEMRLPCQCHPEPSQRLSSAKASP